MKTLTKTIALSALALILSCKKKETKTEEPTTNTPSVPTTDTTVTFKISLYPPAPGRKSWSNPSAIITAGDYKSGPVVITVPTFTYNGSSPCNQYNWNTVESYNLKLKKMTKDTIILQNFESGTTTVNLEAKYVLDLTVSPAKLSYAGSSDHAVICGSIGANCISFGDY